MKTRRTVALLFGAVSAVVTHAARATPSGWVRRPGSGTSPPSAQHHAVRSTEEPGALTWARALYPAVGAQPLDTEGRAARLHPGGAARRVLRSTVHFPEDTTEPPVVTHRSGRAAIDKHPLLLEVLKEHPNAVLVHVGRARYTLHGPTQVGSHDLITVDRQHGATRIRRVASRDWHRHPAVVHIPHDPAVEYYVLSDVHGAYDRMVDLLQAHDVIEPDPDASWERPGTFRLVTGGERRPTLFSLGDGMNGGYQSIPVMDLFQRFAQTAGRSTSGIPVRRFVHLMGNQEAQFLVDPLDVHYERAATSPKPGINHEIRALGLDPTTFAHPDGLRGTFFWNLPVGLALGQRWLFLHSGDTGGRSLDKLARVVSKLGALHGFDHDTLLGKHSILGSKRWEHPDPDTARRYARTLGVNHIVHGHMPSAHGKAPGEIGVSEDRLLVNLDVGMSPAARFDHSPGALFRIRRRGHHELVEALEATGHRELLWKTRVSR
jgi:hypothetical protein